MEVSVLLKLFISSYEVSTLLTPFSRYMSRIPLSNIPNGPMFLKEIKYNWSICSHSPLSIVGRLRSMTVALSVHLIQHLTKIICTFAFHIQQCQTIYFNPFSVVDGGRQFCKYCRRLIWIFSACKFVFTAVTLLAAMGVSKCID